MKIHHFQLKIMDFHDIQWLFQKSVAEGPPQPRDGAAAHGRVLWGLRTPRRTPSASGMRRFQTVLTVARRCRFVRREKVSLAILRLTIRDHPSNPGIRASPLPPCYWARRDFDRHRLPGRNRHGRPCPAGRVFPFLVGRTTADLRP